MFDRTADAMRRHGRDPSGLFDEPMLMVRNQGQILGQEQEGDIVVANGNWSEDTLQATSLRVAPDARPGDGAVVGEIVDRTDTTLHVETADGTVAVEVAASAAIDIPTIVGENDVGQLRSALGVQRMSKSRGNVVSPDELVEKYGADTVRTYLMFAFDWEKGGPWDSRGILGSRRFIEDVWRLCTGRHDGAPGDAESSTALRRRVHQTITKVDKDMQAFKWNTAVAALMSLRNDMQAARRGGEISQDVWDEAVDTLLLLLAPIAPHVTEELWARRGHEESIHLASWPEADAEIAAENTVTMVVQVNGKVRARIDVAADVTPEDAETAALAAERIQSWIEDGEIKRVVVRAPKLVNIVVV
ncbi:MAG: class I tRNA ligase family protein, partial [Acidimicrobiia bacterium]